MKKGDNILCTICKQRGAASFREMYACKACRKACRAHISKIETFDDLLKIPCPGHGNPKVFQINRASWYAFQTVTNVVDWTNGKKVKFNNGCQLCAEEAEKECKVRARKGKHDLQIKRALQETLKERCARIVAMDPGLLLVASTHEPPVGEDLWQMIYEKIPISLNKEYKEALDDSVQNNQSEWMYKTIGTVFSRYVGGTGHKKMKL